LLPNLTSNHPQEDLAKFGYRPDMKVVIFRNAFIFGYLLEPGLGKNFLNEDGTLRKEPYT